MESGAKKILIVSHYYPPHIGGIEIVAYNQAKYLAAQGNSVTILSSDIDASKKKIEKQYDIPGVTEVRVPALNFLEKYSIPFPIFSPTLISNLYRQIKKADVVHVHDAFYSGSFFATIIAHFLKKPVVLMQHVAMINHPSSMVVGFQKLVYKTTGATVFRLANVILTYNDRVTNFLIQRGVPSDKIVRLQNGVDIDVFHPAVAEDKKIARQKFNLDEYKKIILFVGRYAPKKGFDKVIGIASPEYQIVCVGGETPAKPIEHAVFLGKLNQSELAEIYRAADVFLLPSESEGFPLAIQEAMASGLPIITTYDEGYRNYELDAGLFSMLPNPTIDSIRTAVKYIVQDETLQQSMSAYSRAYAVKNFSWKIATDRLSKIYDSVIPKQTVKTIVTTSWDDGHKLDVRLAALLAKYDIKGTFYISPNDEEQKKEDLLTADQIKALSQTMEIGAHTMQHKRLPELADADAFAEMKESKEYLEKVTGTAVTSFCYPCGDYRHKHVKMAERAGFDYARTIHRHSFKTHSLLEADTTIHTYNHFTDIWDILVFAKFNLIKFFNYFENWDNLAIAMFERTQKKGGVFHLWGHSWELEQNHDWDRLENVLKHIARKQGVEYITNKELSTYEKNKPKKVLVVAPYFPPHLGGTQLYVYNIAKRMQDQFGWDVVVATSGDRGFSAKKIETYNGLKVFRLPYWMKLSNTPISPLWFHSFRKIIKNENIDIVHVHTPVPGMPNMAVAVTPKKIPVVLSYHGGSMIKGKLLPDILIWIYEHTALRSLLKRADTIVCTSDYVRNEFLKQYSYKSVTITPGVDLEMFKPAADKIVSKKKNILFVASLTRSEEYKGLTTLLYAVHELQKKTNNFFITIVGDGNMKSGYEHYAKTLGLENIVFMGKLSGDALAEEYRKADIFTLPSSNEGFGMVLLEAMASRLPIVATNVGGIPLLVENGKNGFLVEPNNPQALAEKLYEVVNDSVLAEQLAENGFQKALSKFSWDQRAEQYGKILQREILKRTKEKIAFVLDTVYPFSKGGREKRLHAISIQLAAQGHEVTIYSMKWWKGPDIIVRDGVILYAISPYYSIYVNNRRSLKQAIFFSLHCFKLINKSFDIIDVDHIPQLVLFVAKIVCVLKGKKMIATWHEVWGKKYWQSYMGTMQGTAAYLVEKMSVSLPHSIISVSPHTTSALIALVGTSKNIVTIPNGVDVEFIKHVAPAEQASDIIFAGRLISHKNVDVLLEAIAIIRKDMPNVKVTIVGDGPDTEHLKKISHELDLDRTVTFTGFIETDKDLYAAMHASKVFVLPSIREGFGITVIEANAAGLPVVTIDAEHNAAKELIINNENGALSSLDKNDLAQTIQSALRSRKEPQFYMRYSEKYDWSELIGKIKNVYEQ